MGFNLEQSSAVTRILDWIGAGWHPDRKLTDEQVVDDLLLLGRAAGDRLMMSVREDAIRAAVARVSDLMRPPAELPEGVDPLGEDDDTEHTFPTGARVVVKLDEGDSQRRFIGVVKFRLPSEPEFPSPQYYVLDSDDELVLAFEHQMVLVSEAVPPEHKYTKGTRVRVTPDPGPHPRPYDGIIDRCLGTSLVDPSPRYYVKEVSADPIMNGCIHTDFEHKMTVIPSARTLVDAFNAYQAARSNLPYNYCHTVEKPPADDLGRRVEVRFEGGREVTVDWSLAWTGKNEDKHRAAVAEAIKSLGGREYQVAKATPSRHGWRFELFELVSDGALAAILDGERVA